MSEKQKIYSAMQAIMAEVGSIGKNHTNSFQKYKFVSISDVMEALQPLLVKHNVVCQPDMQERIVPNPEKGFTATVTLRMGFWHTEDGSGYVTSAVGQGSDTGDKAVPKAMACALKYLLRYTFMIPDKEDRVDAEYESPDIKFHPQAKPVITVPGTNTTKRSQ